MTELLAEKECGCGHCQWIGVSLSVKYQIRQIAEGSYTALLPQDSTRYCNKVHMVISQYPVSALTDDKTFQWRQHESLDFVRIMSGSDVCLLNSRVNT